MSNVSQAIEASSASVDSDGVTHHASRVTLCFHCHEPIPARCDLRARIGDRDEAVCCYGCRAVAEMIAGAGLDDYYRFRDAPGQRIVEDKKNEWVAYDQESLLTQIAKKESDGSLSATFVLDGIGCAACAWLIDRMLSREAGVRSVNVNAATARMRIQWRQDESLLSHLLERVSSLGYTPHVVSAQYSADRARDERRAALKRLAVAGLGMMQVMMFATAMYASDLGRTAEAMPTQIRDYLRYVSLLCATPVLFYAGLPFLVTAWRAVRARAMVMDVPVSIGLLLAYFASIWNTVRGTGTVYFDSVTMFVFFLTLGRFIEMMARHRTGDVTDAIARLMPMTAHRVSTDTFDIEKIEDVPVASLAINDVLVVRSGETIPADGVIIEGSSRIDESMLTGESQAVLRGVDDRLVAGTMNLHAPIRLRVTALGQATVLSGIVRLLQKTDEEKAPQASAADRAASWFLGRILVGAGLVAAAWLLIDPSRAFEATLAVLVVTCPCALSLATPTALAAATAALAKKGVLITRTAALEELAKVTRVVFDKTGTLTHGQPQLQRCNVVSGVSESECRRVAFALEQGSEHPLARAFRFSNARAYVATDVQVTAGGGIEGTVAGRRYRIGRREFVSQLRSGVAQGAPLADDSALIYLGDVHRELAAFQIGDRLRNESSTVVNALRKQNLATEILSGDAWTAVANTARECGIETFNARQSPASKLQYVQELAERDEVVAMVGDGINDAPVLKGASVAIAMGRASALAQVSADIVLIGDSLAALPDAIDIARRTQRVIKQNLTWAAVYNLTALPLAAFGFIPPWLAAIGMSVSSIVVVLNALRLHPRRAKIVPMSTTFIPAIANR